MSRPGTAPTVLTVYLLTAAGTALWLGAIFLAPALAARGSSEAARLLYGAFSPICHQIPERCFTFHGQPLAVCGRCLGIYLGFAAGLVLYPFIRGFSKLELPSVRVFLPLTLPMALDGAAGILGIWKSPIGVRFATGAVWGAILPFFFVTGLADLLLTRRKRAAARALEKIRANDVK
jgi:uncharacterized membrane protein